MGRNIQRPNGSDWRKGPTLDHALDAEAPELQHALEKKATKSSHEPPSTTLPHITFSTSLSHFYFGGANVGVIFLLMDYFFIPVCFFYISFCSEVRFITIIFVTIGSTAGRFYVVNVCGDLYVLRVTSVIHINVFEPRIDDLIVRFILVFDWFQ